MAAKFSLIALFYTLCLSTVYAQNSKLHQVDDDNWSQILEGEWMVEFFAPWCPACRSLEPVWQDFSYAAWEDEEVKVAQVDITKSPGLSGRFMITALPTIFHVKDGVFRQYKGSRSLRDFTAFLGEEKWKSIEPLSSWLSPSSIQMSLISQFYRVSMGLRNIMNVMTEQYSIPQWAAYICFGLATILIGLILGLILVCVIDFLYPPMSPKKTDSTTPSGDKSDQDGEKTGDEDEEEDEFTEDIQEEDKDDDISVSQSDTKENISSNTESGAGGDTHEARRRKTRKAD